MLIGALLLTLSAAASAFRAEVRDPKSVKVSVYYETLCPKSRDFITRQLSAHWKDLEDGIQLDLVPYGKSNQTVVDGRWAFQCEHGETECLYNKLHACVIKKLHTHQTKMLRCIRCLMNQEDQVAGLTECLTEIHLKPDVDKFLECMESPDAEDLLAAYGLRTQKNFKVLDRTPKIVFNDKFKKRDQDSALKDFTKLICHLYIPDLCKRKIQML